MSLIILLFSLSLVWIWTCNNLITDYEFLF